MARPELLPRTTLTLDSTMLMGMLIQRLWSGRRVSSGHRRASGFYFPVEFAGTSAALVLGTNINVAPCFI
jgi:hypothetical protein